MSPLRDPYPSRTGQPALFSRREPVVWSADAAAGPWRESEVAQYRNDGFFVREALFSDEEIGALREELTRLESGRELKRRAGVIAAPEGEGLATVFRTPAVSPVLDALSRDPRVLEPVRHLLDAQVYLHQSRANYEAALQRQEFHWHSDFETWHVEDGMPAMRSLSVLITLGDSREYEGPLSFIAGSQASFVSCVGVTPENRFRQAGRAQLYGVPDPVTLSILRDQGEAHTVRAPAGSAIFFDCNVLHAGGAGRVSPESTVSFVYNAADNRLEAPRGRKPRPEYLAARGEPRLLTPQAADYAALAAGLDRADSHAA